MNSEIESHITSLTDLELLKHSRSASYLPEAIEIARKELENRGFSGAALIELEQQLAAEKEHAVETEHEPLSNTWRLAVFLCGLFFGIPLIIFLPTWLRLREEGARRKYREMWLIGVAGLATGLVLTYIVLPLLV
ncbi:MAG: hypothetical protein P8Z31_04050 [Gammaproteobacteria bacterium]|jgi:uncharacterized membrane protein (DUF485 family)